MDVVMHAAGLPELHSHGRRPEPRWLTLVDLGVIVAGVALEMTIPSRALGWPTFVPPPPLLFLVAIGGLRLAQALGLVLALVVLFRRGRYGGPVRPAEWLALGLASLGLLDTVPNLDGVVNAYYAAAGSAALDFGVARWLLSVPAAVGVVLVVVGLALLRRRVRAGSRVASALTVAGSMCGLLLWFWGPCEVARLQLPWLLVPGLKGDPSSWGWRAPVVFSLREVVANGPTGLTWGLPAAALVRTWLDDRRRGRSRAWVWTEPASCADAVVAFLLLTTVGPVPIDLFSWVSLVVSVGLASWWLTGHLGGGRDPAPPPQSFAS
jgi:hypothetical protein